MAGSAKRVTSLAELEEGPQLVNVAGKKVLVARTVEGVAAYRNVCPHQMGPVVEGRLDDEANRVICPWHGWEFSLEDGRNPMIDLSLIRVDVTVEDGEVYLEP